MGVLHNDTVWEDKDHALGSQFNPKPTPDGGLARTSERSPDEHRVDRGGQRAGGE